MRATTEVWMRCESKGKPANTATLGPLAAARIAPEILRWLLATPMGHYMRITLARTEAELDAASGREDRSKAGQDSLLDEAMRELDEMLAGLGGASECEHEPADNHNTAGEAAHDAAKPQESR